MFNGGVQKSSQIGQQTTSSHACRQKPVLVVKASPLVAAKNLFRFLKSKTSVKKRIQLIVVAKHEIIFVKEDT